MNIRPLDDKIVIRPHETATKTPGGLELPDVARDKPEQGTVVAVGPGPRRASDGVRMGVDVRVDDVVCFPPFCGLDLKLEGETFLVMREDDLLAVIEEG